MSKSMGMLWRASRAAYRRWLKAVVESDGEVTAADIGEHPHRKGWTLVSYDIRNVTDVDAEYAEYLLDGLD